MSDLHADSKGSSVTPLLRDCLLDEVGQLADDHDGREARGEVERRLEFVQAIVSGKLPRLEAWFKHALQP